MALKKILIGVVAVYLGIGVLFYAPSFMQQLKTYECKDATVPHGYITIFNDSFTPPSGECSRRALQVSEIGTATAMITLWPMLIIGQALYGN